MEPLGYLDYLKIPPAILPSGQVVCGAHRFVTCPLCCLDFSFMEEEDVDDEDEENESDDFDEESDDMDERLYESDGTADSPRGFSFIEDLKPTFSEDPRIGTGRVLPERFIPPDSKASPRALFPPGISKRAGPWVH